MKQEEARKILGLWCLYWGILLLGIVLFNVWNQWFPVHGVPTINSNLLESELIPFMVIVTGMIGICGTFYQGLIQMKRKGNVK